MAENKDNQQRTQQAPQEPAEAEAQQTQQAQGAQRLVIHIDTSGYDPATDPGNPAFDRQKWQEAVDRAGGLDAMTERLAQSVWDSVPTEQISSLLEGLRRNPAPLVRLADDTDGILSPLASLAPRIEEIQRQTIEAMRSRLGDLAPKIADMQQLVINSLASTLEELRESFDRMITAWLTGDVTESLEIWETLKPYMTAEAEAHPELENEPAPDLIARAAAAARADGKDIPPLQAEQPDPDYWRDALEIEIDLPTEGTNKEEAPAESACSKRTEAEAGGALTSIGNRLLVPSDPEFQNAFISNLTGDIGIFVIDTLTGIQLRDKGAELSFVENGITDLLDANKRTGAKPLQDADTGLLRAMAKGAYITKTRSDSMTTSFYLPAFCDELGIQGYHEKGTDRAEARKRQVLDWIDSMGSAWGKLPGSTQWWKVFTVIGYDPKTEIVTVAMPYFNQLLAAIERKRQRQLDAGKKFYIGYCDLLHASAANERNKAAVELATRVLIGVQQRGGTPDKKLKQNRNKAIRSDTICTWKISCAGLIADCPQMQDKLTAQKSTDGKNKLMQRAFTTMYKVLRDKSDLFTYYKDVKITEVIPTSKTRTAEIIVTHHGINPDYHRPALVLDADGAEAEPAEAEAPQPH